MERTDEWVIRRMCDNLGLEYYYDSLRPDYVFQRKPDPSSVSDQLEYCFGGPERKLYVPVFYLRRMDSIDLYKRLREEFSS
jgi:hypothetical protein